MPIVSNSEIVVTDDDRRWAREVICEAWHNCRATNIIGKIGKPCDCDMSLIDGCKAKIEAVAQAIAYARVM